MDCLLTDPTRWDTGFVVMDGERPTGKIGEFVKALPEGLVKSSPIHLYQDAYEKSGYARDIRWAVDNLWSSPEVVNFYNLKEVMKSGKIVLSTNEYEGVLRAKQSIIENDFTNYFFYQVFVHHEIMHQVAIYFTYKGVECKALLDGILIDHRGRTIQPFDLKTTGKSVYDFQDSFLYWGYYRQGAFYERALYSKQSPIKDLLKSGYKMLDFIFIVVESSKDSLNPAIIYRTTEKDRYCGINGGHVRGKFYKGIDNLLDDYLFYTKNDLWDLPKDLLDSNGEVVLDIFN